MSEFESRVAREVCRLEVNANGRWQSEDKGRNIAESMAPHVVISEVARQHGLDPQQLFS